MSELQGHLGYAERAGAKDADERRELEEKADKENARQIFLSEGGDPSAFEAFWKIVVNERAKALVMDKRKAAREAQRRSRTSQL